MRPALELGSVRVGPVSRDDLKRLTGLLPRTAQANVPQGTRGIAVVIAVSAGGNGANHAYVDNISLTLGKAVAHPVQRSEADARRRLQGEGVQRRRAAGQGLRRDLGHVPRRRQGGGARQEVAVHRTRRHGRAAQPESRSPHASSPPARPPS